MFRPPPEGSHSKVNDIQDAIATGFALTELDVHSAPMDLPMVRVRKETGREGMVTAITELRLQWYTANSESSLCESKTCLTHRKQSNIDVQL